MRLQVELQWEKVMYYPCINRCFDRKERKRRKQDGGVGLLSPRVGRIQGKE